MRKEREGKRPEEDDSEPRNQAMNYIILENTAGDLELQEGQKIAFRWHFLLPTQGLNPSNDNHSYPERYKNAKEQTLLNQWELAAAVGRGWTQEVIRQTRKHKGLLTEKAERTLCAP